jgi:hypothetical protein
MSKPEHVVVLHLDADGSVSLRVWGDERVCVLWVDETCPTDRVYCQTARETDPEALRALIGDSPIGHYGDGTLTPETEQAIRAALWRAEGGRLQLVEINNETGDRTQAS